MVLLFVSGAEALSVQHQHFNRLTIGSESIDGFTPDPDTLSAESKTKLASKIAVAQLVLRLTLVHALIVWPTSNPRLLFNRHRFSK